MNNIANKQTFDFPNKAKNHQNSTNLYISKINKSASEIQIMKAFAQWGPIASCKVLWPRQNDDPRPFNSGFVSFMRQADAEKAFEEMDGKLFMGNRLVVDWAKPVSLPLVAIYDESKVDGVMANEKEFIKVVVPASEDLLKTVNTMAEYVLNNGPGFEREIIKRESSNPKFSFLTSFKSPDHIYYRWKVYSLLQGDQMETWATDSFQIEVGGPFYIPPDMEQILFKEQSMDDLSDEYVSTDESIIASDEDSEVHNKKKSNISPQKGNLSNAQKRYLDVKLRNLTTEREKISRLMVFCMDHADCSSQIVDTIVASITIDKTPLFPVKLGRLYLISDILHNSSSTVPNAWKYRMHFEKRLPEIFDHFGFILHSIVVLNFWGSWVIFTGDLIGDCLDRFLKKKQTITTIDIQIEKEKEIIKDLEILETTKGEGEKQSMWKTIDSNISKWKTVDETAEHTKSSSQWKSVESAKPENEITIPIENKWKSATIPTTTSTTTTTTSANKFKLSSSNEKKPLMFKPMITKISSSLSNKPASLMPKPTTLLSTERSKPTSVFNLSKPKPSSNTLTAKKPFMKIQLKTASLASPTPIDQKTQQSTKEVLEEAVPFSITNQPNELVMVDEVGEEENNWDGVPMTEEDWIGVVIPNDEDLDGVLMDDEDFFMETEREIVEKPREMFEIDDMFS